MAFEKEKDTILRVLLNAGQGVPVSRKTIMDKTNLGRVEVDLLINHLRNDYHYIGFTGQYDEYGIMLQQSEKGILFIKSTSFQKLAKTESNQRNINLIIQISTPIISIIAVFIAWLSYSNEKSNTHETREKLNANVEMLKLRIDSLGITMDNLFSTHREQTPKKMQQKANEKHADSIIDDTAISNRH